MLTKIRDGLWIDLQEIVLIETHIESILFKNKDPYGLQRKDLLSIEKKLEEINNFKITECTITNKYLDMRDIKDE